MTTLATLKSQIATDIDDSAGVYTSDIADAITRAIEYYQPVRFDFNETRDVTFNTAEDKQIYTSADNANIPLFYARDLVTIVIGGQVRTLELVDHREMEWLSDNSASKGQPYSYTYFNKSIRIYPIPDQSYEVRLIGHIRKNEPATDAEADNVWMVDAFQLIRCKSKEYLAADLNMDGDLEARMARRAEMEEDRLSGLSAARIGSGFIVPTEF